MKKAPKPVSGGCGLDLYFDFSRKFLPDGRNSCIKSHGGECPGRGAQEELEREAGPRL